MINTHPFKQVRNDNVSFNDIPSQTNIDAVTDLSVILSRYVRGLGIPTTMVHPAQYSEQLSPLTSKGVDLCDYSDIKEQNAIDVQTLTDDAIAQDKAARVSKQVEPQVTPPAE